MNALLLSWQMLRRDFRAGEMRLLGLAMIIAVASLTSVSFFTDRLSQRLTRDANQLLGGDLLLVADHALNAEFGDQARREGLRALSSWSFTSMASADSGAQLAGVKAVEAGYPLRGVLRTAPGLNMPDALAESIPAQGTVWLDERLCSALGVKPGDEIGLGNSRFRVAAVLTFESDRGTNFFSLLPRLMVNAADLPATGLIQLGSRVTYRLHVAGEPRPVAVFQKWAKARLGPGESLEDIENARPEVRAGLERAQKFLRLAALLAVVLAAVAVGLAARRFMQRHLDGCAVMRCLGARQAQVSRLFMGEFVIFGLIASALGCALGYGAQMVMERMLAGLLNAALPAPSLLPFAYGFGVGMALLAGFVVPQLVSLANVPTLRVLRREWSGAEPVTVATYVLGIGTLAGLMFWMAADLRLGAVVLGGFTVAILVYGLVARLALAAAGGVRSAGGAGWRYGVASLRRRMGSSLIQTVALGVGITALLLLTLTRDELLTHWRQSVPPDAPNRFIINIQPDQRAELADTIVARGLPRPELLPMVRGRLVSVNGKAVTPDNYSNERAQRLVDREFNLSYLENLPPGNSVVQGRWFGREDRGQPLFSVEQGLAETLGLKLGDRLEFDVAGNRVEARVSSLRKLNWDSMRVNFFVVAPPGVIDDFPTSYITAFHLSAGQEKLVNDLVARFPNLTVIDVDAVLSQIRSVSDQLARAVQFVFLFALLAGVVVLFAALESTHDERAYELAILRTLGARNRQLRGALLAEFAALGAVAGLLAGVGATAIGYGLAHFVFKLDLGPNWLTPAIGFAAGLFGVTLAGWLGTLRTMGRPALQSLRALS
ncbi:MAG: FtsX-like permease family protein [Rhodocyclaceae bacterium]